MFISESRKKLISAWRFLFWDHPFRRGAVYVVSFLGGLGTLLVGIKGFLDVVTDEKLEYLSKITNLEIPPIYLYLVVCLSVLIAFYMFVVALLAANQAVSERDWRELQQAFNYDNRGTLLNLDQPNIAFRIVTFNGMLEGIVRAGIKRRELQGALKKAGEAAAENFAMELSEIYSADIRRLADRGKPPWNILTFSQKLQEWCSYDSATGWGIMKADRKAERITISFAHFQGLFSSAEPDEGAGPDDKNIRYHDLFPYFLQGYCTTMLRNIVRNHEGPLAEGITDAQSEGKPEQIGESLTMTFKLI